MSNTRNECGHSQRNQQQDAKGADDPRWVPVLAAYVSDAEEKHGSYADQGNRRLPAHQGQFGSTYATEIVAYGVTGTAIVQWDFCISLRV